MRAIVKKIGATKKRILPASGTTGTAIELPEGMWERIARKAYELWEQRGRQEGNELRDWLDAEEIVMEEIHEARE
jgi:hypothetical protein